MEPTSNLTLEGLTARIAENSKIISDCIQKQNIPQLTLGPEAPSDFPVPPDFPEVHVARLAVQEATRLLDRLLSGPDESAHRMAYCHHETAALRTLYRFKVFEAVPLDKPISYADISKKIGLDEDRTRRIMQFAITTGCFEQTKDGLATHSGVSATLAKNEKLRAMIGHSVEDVYPAAARMTDCAWDHPVNNEEPNGTGFQLANNTDKGFFDILNQDPVRAHRFDMAMSSLSVPGGLFDSAHVLNAFDFSSLGDATMVDLGGGRGHVSVKIAEANPSMKFIVQDRPEAVQDGEKSISPQLKSRFQFMEFDFFKPQPNFPNGYPSVYFLRFILHDWSDKYSVKILKGLVPAMKDGSKVLINESILPPFGTVNKTLDALGRILDMQMLTVLNAKERTVPEFESLFKQADPRFGLVGVHRSPGSPLGILEFQFSQKQNGS